MLTEKAIVYFAFLLVPVAWFVLFQTTWGLIVRAVGMTPQAVDTLGVSVTKVRYECLILGGMLAGLGRGDTDGRQYPYVCG